MNQSMDLAASHYGKLDKTNPVIISFLRDINSFMTLMKKVASSPTQDNSGYVKGVKMLMEIWKKYKHRLPPSLYQEKMLQVADNLLELKFHELALWYGYSLHLQQYTSVDFSDIEDIDHFKSCFFPEGLNTDQDILVMKIWALHGCALCTFERIKDLDILTPEDLYQLICILDVIRFIMQLFQHHDSLCWLIHNGSVLIYNICRFLMTHNYSAQALEYLLWASFSIELSVPLMTSHTVPWLVTLHCAVCQCYYDNQASVQGEVFARRALVKINEIANLEEQSGISASKDNGAKFKEASIKLATMVFKRAVFEARTKTFRFKMKKKLSDIPNAPWPRTTTEQMLNSLFEGGAAQFLAILEALRDNSRSLPQTEGSEDLEVQDVVLELLAAAISLLSDSELKNESQLPGSLCAVTTSSSQINLAVAGGKQICFEAAVEFIKQLYYYKQPEAFTEYSREMLQLLSDTKCSAQMELRLLYYFNHVQKERPSISSISDEFLELLKTLHKYVCDCDSVPNRDLVLPVMLFVWNKVDSVIERAQQHHSESKLEEGAWCLAVLCEVAFAFDLCSSHYFIMAGEMTLKLAMLLESAAKREEKINAPEVKFGEEFSGTLSSFSLNKSSSTELLQKLCDVVKKWLMAFSKGLSKKQLQDGAALFDGASVQKNVTQLSSSPSEERVSEDICPDVETKPTWSRHDFLLALDLHLHLKAIYYRASLCLLHCNAEFEVLQQIKTNKISRAVFLMQKALIEYNMETESSNIKALLEESGQLIRKAVSEETKLYMSTLATNQDALTTHGRRNKDEKVNPPPAPVLVSRSDHSLSFVPAPYIQNQDTVCWYQLLGRSAEGTNLKVRLGDSSLPGTGHVIPSDCGRCVLKVEGLNPDHKYVFAVAAYNSQGDLVGNSIGETTMPILASPPLPLLTTWALLAQVAFQTKQYDIAKRVCQKLWGHFTLTETRHDNIPYKLVTPRLQVPILHLSSLALRQLFFASIFTETEINIHNMSLQCNLFTNRGLFIWAQIARLEECERMLVAIDLVPWLIDHSDALQAVIVCYALLTPIIYHQVPCNPVIQVLTKCLKVLEKNLPQLKLRWTGRTTETLMHRVACITYYLCKALHTFQEKEKATEVVDCGISLIQEIYNSQNKLFTSPIRAESILKSEKKISPQLKALLGKNKTKINDNSSIIAYIEEHTKMCDILSSTPIKRAFQEVMKLKQKELFIELSTLLLQRVLDEGEAELLIEWEQNLMELLRKLTETSQCETKGATSVNELQANAKTKPSHGQVQRAKTLSEKRNEKNINRFKKLVMLRKIHCEESVWRTNLNFAVAQAHLTLFHKALSQLPKGPLLNRYSQIDSLEFSTACSGVPVRMRKNTQQQLLSQHSCVLERDKKIETKTEAQEYDESHSCTKETGENGSSLHTEQSFEMQKQTAAFMLDSLTKAGLHLRRAMVLAHRNSHWAMLRSVCLTMWDHYCRTAGIVERGAHLELSFFITAEQQHNIFRPLLVLATKLIMDMLRQLELWHVYEKDLSEEEAQSCLHFSVHLDETTKMDMRWVKTLVIHTLEQLHESGKWENLSHLALLFNTYTRDHYALIVSPLLINAQRKLLERIQSVQGPSVPQPHHVKTKEVTQHKVTYKSYANTQLLSGWTPSQKVPKLKKEARSRDRLIDAEVRRALALVCVPLDVEDTLFWYRKAVEKRSPSLEFFQHSRLHLQLLLANTQIYYSVRVKSKEASRSVNKVEFNPLRKASVKRSDLMEEDYRTIDTLYSLPLSPDHVPIVTAEYTTAINYFHENKCDSLTVLALHEVGNLHHYNGNKKAAHACWAKAINSALKSQDALEKWDGVTFGGCSMQQRLKLSGVWGCLQAACITAKIAQYILTTDISKRTNFCLQSAHLFKCVLCCSLAQPQADLHFASGLVIHELLPGVDLFSDPSRVHLGTTVTSLSFICQWLFSTGHYIKLLPMLALCLYCVDSVCRDAHRAIECKILKIRTLTALGLFTEAVRESVLLTKGAGVPLPHQLQNAFNNTKSVLNNTEALEDLVNSEFTSGICTHYESKLYLHFNLARAQLILAICATISGPLQVPESNISTESQQEDAKLLDLESIRDQLTEGQLKYFLLEAVSSLSNSVTEQLEEYRYVDRAELTVESNILKSKLNLLKGQAALSAEMAVSSLKLLQSACKNTVAPTSVFEQKAPHKHTRSEEETLHGRNQFCLEGDCVEMVQSSERIGCLLWIRCRLTLVHCLTAHDFNSDGSGQEDNQLKNKIAQVIMDGIEECKRWGDPDSQALFMLEAAKWESDKADKSTQVKEIVSLLSGQLNMPPLSAITLAQATLLLNDMKTPESITFLKLSQKLLKHQLCSVSPNVTLDDGHSNFTCSSNTCLPFLHLLFHTISCVGQLIES